MKKIINERNKNIWKLVLLVFLANIIILNWSDIYWVFNPKVAPKGIQTLIGGDQDYNKNVQIEEDDYYEKENSIEIAAIEINAPVVESAGITDKDFEIALDKGVVRFPDSVKPGEDGLLILLGHSAPAGWPKINYDWVFSDLEKLKNGDEISVYFENKKYTYIVIEKTFLEIGEDIPSYLSEKKEIILLSCWPPGKNIKRIGIRGVLAED